MEPLFFEEWNIRAGPIFRRTELEFLTPLQFLDGRSAGSGSWIVCAAPGRLLDLICAEEEEGEQFTDGPARAAFDR